MPVAENARRVLRLAAEEARKRGDREYDREHLLLALCQLSGEPGVRGAAILERLGMDEGRVREVIDRHRPPQPELDETPLKVGWPPNQQVFPAHMIERVHIHGRWLAAHFGQRAQDTEHLLLGVLSDEGSEDKIFRDLGLRFEDAYQELAGEPPPRELLPPRDVIVPIGDFYIALRMLPKVLPAGVHPSHNFDDEYGWFGTEHDIDLEHYVRKALALGLK
jgi:hypothetical protein